MRKEIADRCGDFVCMSLEREVAGVEKVDGRTRNVAAESFGSARQKERIVLSPCCQEAWLMGPEVILERWVERQRCSCNRPTDPTGFRLRPGGPDKNYRENSRPEKRR